jgi:uncharacterized protein YceH (UPF0502 family)
MSIGNVSIFAPQLALIKAAVLRTPYNRLHACGRAHRLHDYSL